ncbi:hypothetical protein GCM10027615_15680 [Plantactinospora veratri]
MLAVVDHGIGETVEALATFPTAERADTIADLLNLLTVGHPPAQTRDRLLAALDAEPGPVRTSVISILDSLGPNRHALAARLRRRTTAGIASFPGTSCPSEGAAPVRPAATDVSTARPAAAATATPVCRR